jgi:hypothetical protein
MEVDFIKMKLGAGLAKFLAEYMDSEGTSLAEAYKSPYRLPFLIIDKERIREFVKDNKSMLVDFSKDILSNDENWLFFEKFSVVVKTIFFEFVKYINKELAKWQMAKIWNWTAYLLLLEIKKNMED